LTEQGRYPLAISYYTSAEDWPGVGRIVDLILSQSIVDGPSLDEIWLCGSSNGIDCAGPADFVASVLDMTPALKCPPSYGQSIFQRRLSFLVRYAEFHKHWSNGDIQDAAGDVVSMFRDELVPKSWWGVLLKQAGELLLQDRTSTSKALPRRHELALTWTRLLVAEIMPFEVLEVFELLRRLEELQTRAAQGSGPEYLSALIRQLGNGGEREALRQLESVRLALARYFARCSVLAVGGKGRILFTQST